MGLEPCYKLIFTCTLFLIACFHYTRRKKVVVLIYLAAITLFLFLLSKRNDLFSFQTKEHEALLCALHACVMIIKCVFLSPIFSLLFNLIQCNAMRSVALLSIEEFIAHAIQFRAIHHQLQLATMNCNGVDLSFFNKLKIIVCSHFEHHSKSAIKCTYFYAIFTNPIRKSQMHLNSRLIGSGGQKFLF